MCVQNLKSIALPVPEIIGVAEKFRAVSDYAHTAYSPFPKKYRLSIQLDYKSTCTGFTAFFNRSFA